MNNVAEDIIKETKESIKEYIESVGKKSDNVVRKSLIYSLLSIFLTFVCWVFLNHVTVSVNVKEIATEMKNAVVSISEIKKNKADRNDFINLKEYIKEELKEINEELKEINEDIEGIKNKN